MKIGIVGFGSIAKKVYLPLYLDNKEIKEIYVYGRDKQKLENKLNNYNLNICDSFDQMLDMVDVLMVHSATVSHYQYIKKALNKKIATYVDKPLSDDLSKSTELLKLAKEKDCLLFVGYNRRYTSLYKKLENMDLKINRIFYEKHRKEITLNENYKDAIIDDFIHSIDYVNFCLEKELKLNYANYKATSNSELITLYTDYSDSEQIINLFMARNSGSDFEKISIDAKDYLITIENMRTMTIKKDNKVEIIEVNQRLSDSVIRGFNEALENFYKLAKENKFIDLKQFEAEVLCANIIEKLDS